MLTVQGCSETELFRVIVLIKKFEIEFKFQKWSKKLRTFFVFEITAIELVVVNCDYFKENKKISK